MHTKKTINKLLNIRSMEKSALHIARSAYQPKLPLGLQGNVSVKEGAPTQSVADQEEIKKLFLSNQTYKVI